MIVILGVKVAHVTSPLLSTGEPRYPQSFYLRIRLFTIEILIKMGQISSQNVSFYLRIQYSRSKIAGRNNREYRGIPVFRIW
jgi:hypothetical protein